MLFLLKYNLVSALKVGGNIKKFFVMALCTFFILGLTSLVACKNETVKSSIRKTSSSEEIPRDDPMPIKGKLFYDFNQLCSYVSTDFENKNKSTFYLILPDKKVDEMGCGFSINYDYDDNGILSNPIVNEFFFIYDEELGTLSNTSMDVPYYSMKFECYFYPIGHKKGIDTNDYNIKNISGTKIQIYIDNSFIINVEMANLNQTNYVIEYLNKNLV